MNKNTEPPRNPLRETCMVAGRAAIASITVPLGMLLGLGGLIQHRLRSRRPGRNPHAPAREGRA